MNEQLLTTDQLTELARVAALTAEEHQTTEAVVAAGQAAVLNSMMRRSG